MTESKESQLRELEVLSKVCATVRYLPLYTEGQPATKNKAEVAPKVKGTVSVNLLSFDEITAVKIRMKNLMVQLGVEFLETNKEEIKGE